MQKLFSCILLLKNTRIFKHPKSYAEYHIQKMEIFDFYNISTNHLCLYQHYFYLFGSFTPFSKQISFCLLFAIFSPVIEWRVCKGSPDSDIGYLLKLPYFYTQQRLIKFSTFGFNKFDPVSKHMDAPTQKLQQLSGSLLTLPCNPTNF